MVTFCKGKKQAIKQARADSKKGLIFHAVFYEGCFYSVAGNQLEENDSLIASYLDGFLHFNKI